MLPQSPCDYIPDSQVIALTKMRLNISTANYDGYFRIEIENCLRKMYTPSIYECQYKIVDICDNAIKVPPGCRKIMGVQFCQPNPASTTDDDTGLGIIATPNNFYIANFLGGLYPAYGNCRIENYFTVQDGYLYFSQETEETLAIVWYYGFRSNEKGLIMIPDYFESCLSWNLCYNYTLKNPTCINGDFYATARIRQEYKKNYMSEKGQIIGNDQMEKFDEEKKALRFAMNKMNMRDFNWWPFFAGAITN